MTERDKKRLAYTEKITRERDWVIEEKENSWIRLTKRHR